MGHFNLLTDAWKLVHWKKLILNYSYLSLNSSYKSKRMWYRTSFLWFTAMVLHAAWSFHGNENSSCNLLGCDAV